MQLVILGPPGAGKGTQGELLVERLHIPHISTGDMFRQAISEETPMGQTAKTYLESGRLVPDEVTIGIVRERLQKEDCQAGFLLDGFPRTVAQAEALDHIMQQLGRSLTAVLDIQVDRGELLDRLTGRRLCRQCQATYHLVFSPPREEGRCDRCAGELYQRTDDTPETVAQRLDVYLEQTSPVLYYYRERGLLQTIDGDQPVGEVFAAIGKALGKDLLL